MPGRASSHREAPLISGDPQASTDVYAFVSPDARSTVTLISSWIPLRIRKADRTSINSATACSTKLIDDNGDAVEDITYQISLHLANTQPEHVSLQHRADSVDRRRQPQPVANLYVDAYRQRPHHIDLSPVPCSMPTTSVPHQRQTTAEWAAASPNTLKPIGGKGRVFAGQTDDAFFLDLRIFDLLAGRWKRGTTASLVITSARSPFRFRSRPSRGQPSDRRVGDRQPTCGDHARLESESTRAPWCRCRVSACRSSTKSSNQTKDH